MGRRGACVSKVPLAPLLSSAPSHDEFQRYLLVEVKLATFFLSLFFSASLMSTAKSVRVVLVIALLDAGSLWSLRMPRNSISTRPCMKDRRIVTAVRKPVRTERRSLVHRRYGYVRVCCRLAIDLPVKTWEAKPWQ